MHSTVVPHVIGLLTVLAQHRLLAVTGPFTWNEVKGPPLLVAKHRPPMSNAFIPHSLALCLNAFFLPWGVCAESASESSVM